MSTPAIITKKNNPTLELYIHFDGDNIEMIQEIVNVAYKDCARNINDDEYYGMARLCCACGKYFGFKETGFGVAPYGKEYYDYHYVIDENWNVKAVEE